MRLNRNTNFQSSTHALYLRVATAAKYGTLITSPPTATSMGRESVHCGWFFGVGDCLVGPWFLDRGGGLIVAVIRVRRFVQDGR